MALANAINASQTGFQSQTSAGIWNGRTLTAGTGISITNGDGISGNPVISANGAAPDFSTNFIFWDDFLASKQTGSQNVIWSAQNWATIEASSNNPSVPSTQVAGRPGIIGITAGPNSEGACLSNAAASATPSYVSAGVGIFTYEASIKLDTLSVTNQVYVARVGIGNPVANSTEPTNGIYLAYTNTVNSGNWVGITRNASTSTSVNSSVAGSTNWIKLKFVANAAATSVEFFIDGVSIGTSATNIPTSQVGFFFQMARVSGANSKVMDIDYMTSTCALTTAR